MQSRAFPVSQLLARHWLLPLFSRLEWLKAMATVTLTGPPIVFHVVLWLVLTLECFFLDIVVRVIWF